MRGFLLLALLVLFPSACRGQEREPAAGEEVAPEYLVRRGIDHFFRLSEIPDSTFQQMLGKSYPADCPVPRGDLRYLRVLHKDAQGRTLVGEMVAGIAIAEDLMRILRQLYDASYPIERMVLVDRYEADDELSMRANNSSCFNFRFITHTHIISKHGRGEAVDINPLYNPYYKIRNDGSSCIEPLTGAAYIDRNASYPYKIEEGDLCWQLFKAFGFTWGGDWTSCKDWQHFER